MIKGMGWIGQIKWKIHFKITKTSYKKCKIWTSHANSSLVFVNMASLDLVQIGLFLSFDHILLRFLLYQENNFMLLLDSGNKISCHLWNIYLFQTYFILDARIMIWLKLVCCLKSQVYSCYYFTLSLLLKKVLWYTEAWHYK